MARLSPWSRVHLPRNESIRLFKQWFWRPPRPHGETIADREVSFLELFYDLVYVAVISQATHHLAEHTSTDGVIDFAIVFAMIWIAWVNGSLYIELHGREDGRTRLIVFLQMGILVLLAVFTGDAAGDGGQTFALIYVALLLVVAWFWSLVREQDRVNHPEYVADTARYLIGMALSTIVILVSAVLPDGPRLALWTVFSIGWIVGLLTLSWLGIGLERGLKPTPSLVERFAAFTIIVLGEAIFGVVNGLSIAERDVLTIATGMLALVLAFGFWWIYFDLIGRRLPREDGLSLTGWVLSHLPVTMAIAAAGAAMVTLIEHAHDARTPEGTAWLIASAVALGLIAAAVIEQALADARRLAFVYRPLNVAMGAGAIAALVIGWARPAPWLLALLLVTILTGLWFFAVSRFLAADAWSEANSASSHSRS
jgi:low temperature requirement protein LtrA